jgi:hypothetical protein
MSGLASRLHAADTHFDKLANLPFKENRPAKQTAQTLRDGLLFQRATQTYLWAFAVDQYARMKDGSEKVFSAQPDNFPPRASGAF